MNIRIFKGISKSSCKNLLVARSKLQKITTYKRIVSTNPKERFQADTTHLSLSLQKDQAKHLLNIKDHFSRYSWSFIIPDITALSLAKCLKKIILME